MIQFMLNGIRLYLLNISSFPLLIVSIFYTLAKGPQLNFACFENTSVHSVHTVILLFL